MDFVLIKWMNENSWSVLSEQQFGYSLNPNIIGEILSIKYDNKFYEGAVLEIG